MRATTVGTLGREGCRPQRPASIQTSQERGRHGGLIGYNAIAPPIAAGVFEPFVGLVLRPEIAALSMSGSSLLVAMNALLLKRVQLPAPDLGAGQPPPLSR